MPLSPSEFSPPLIFRNNHLATIYSGLFRKVPDIPYQRERITLPDGDFLDLDWSYAETANSQVVILLHGLEGDARRPYMAGSALMLNTHGFDACSVNLRGCSGEPNRLFRSYHSGATEDLDAVVSHVAERSGYRDIFLLGFSLGGNLCLKYLGEGRDVPGQIKAAVAISVPCDLYSSLRALMSPANFLYANRFKRHLLAKLRIKQKLFPSQISEKEIRKVHTLKDFDDVYTSKAHGFDDAMDYYNKCSCRQFLPGIRIPSLLINARNDSFLGPECYPVSEAESHPYLHLEIPTYGGHVGFFGMKNQYYTEKRTIKFLQAST